MGVREGEELQVAMLFRKFPSTATQFPPISTQDWERQIEADLKAGSAASLFWRSPEGLSLAPYYRAEHLQGLLHLNSLPGAPPYLRGGGCSSNRWDILQRIESRELASGLQEAERLLAAGADGLLFPFGRDAIPFPAQGDIEQILGHLVRLAMQKQGAEQQGTERQAAGRQRAERPGIERQGIERGGCFVHLKAGDKAPDLVRLLCDAFVVEAAAGAEVGDAASASVGADLGGEVARGLQFAIDHDPFSVWLSSGSMPLSLDRFWADSAELIALSIRSNLPLYCLNVAGATFRNAGAGPLQELAFSLAAAAEYMVRLSSFADLDPQDLASRLFFALGIGSDYFLEIARLRALPLLWSRIAAEFLPKGDYLPPPRIQAESCCYNKSLYDSHSNVLRATLEQMAAVLGGASAFTALPFDLIKGGRNELAKDLERNLQLLSRWEAYLDRVVDPAAGSYYLENLTDQVARRVWSMFQEIERAGGFLELLKRGAIKEQIDAFHLETEQAAARRRIILLGVNQYPNPSEKLWEQLCANRSPANLPAKGSSESPLNISSGISSGSSSGIPSGISSNTSSAPSGGDRMAPLKSRRIAWPFERLRLAMERHVAGGGGQPHLSLFAFGDPALRRARADFALHFFGCGGYAPREQLLFDTIEEGLPTLLNLRSDIVVFCSSDRDYGAEQGERLAVALRRLRDGPNVPEAPEAPEAPDTSNASPGPAPPLLVLAGSPQALRAQIKESRESRESEESRRWQFIERSLYGFIHKKSDLLSELRRYHGHFGISEEDLCDPLLQI